MTGNNYVANARRLLEEELGEEHACEPELLDLYCLLVLSKGVACSLEDVHDAWAVWRNDTAPNHKSIVFFSRLTSEIQEYDRPYRDAIRRAAARMFWPTVEEEELRERFLRATRISWDR